MDLKNDIVYHNGTTKYQREMGKMQSIDIHLL